MHIEATRQAVATPHRMMTWHYASQNVSARQLGFGVVATPSSTNRGGTTDTGDGADARMASIVDHKQDEADSLYRIIQSNSV